MHCCPKRDLRRARVGDFFPSGPAVFDAGDDQVTGRVAAPVLGPDDFQAVVCCHHRVPVELWINAIGAEVIVKPLLGFIF